MQACRTSALGAYRHFHSSVGVATPCTSSSTQDTERLCTPPPQEVEQEVQGLLSHLGGGGGRRGQVCAGPERLTRLGGTYRGRGW